MKSLIQQTHPSHGKRSLGRGSRLVALLAVFCLLVGTALAAMPPAGSVIGNQATATFHDGTTIRTVTSNLVQTTVTQVAAMTITPDQTKYGTAGNPVYLPHTVTNTGNGPDTFTLGQVTTPGTLALSGTAFYLDANSDGLPDSTTPITSLTLAAGEVANIVVGTTIGAGATTGTDGTVAVTATSVHTGTVTATATDTVKLTTTALIQVTKSMSVSSGPSPSSSDFTVTLAYSNTGVAAATNLVLTDLLPTGMTYVAGSGLWSHSGTALTDTAGGDPAGILYDYNVTTPGTVTATIASVPAGFAGTLKFKVAIASGLSGGTVVTNKAQFKCDETPELTTTNTASYTVTGTRSVVFDPAAPTVAKAKPGETVSFTNTLKNTGTSTDTYNLVLNTATSTFPAGTSFTLARTGGTPFTDTNNDGIVDTGPLAPGAAIDVLVKATLPVPWPANASNGPFAISKTATSITDSTISATATDTLTTVELHDLAFSPDNLGQQIQAGASNLYRHTLTNLGTVAETAALAGNTPLTLTNSASGWTAKLYIDVNNDGVIDPADVEVATLGAALTATGQTALAVNGKLYFIVKVTAPPTAATGDTNTTTVTATLTRTDSVTDGNSANNTARDESTVSPSNILTLKKEQALNAACGAITGLTFSANPINGKPGECITYKVTLTNPTATSATHVQIQDATPSYTTLCSSSGSCVAPAGAGLTGTVTAPGDGATGTLTYGSGLLAETLAPGATATLTLTVKINN